MTNVDGSVRAGRPLPLEQLESSAFVIKDKSTVVTLDLKFTLLTLTLSYSLSLKRCGSKQQMSTIAE